MRASFRDSALGLAALCLGALLLPYVPRALAADPPATASAAPVASPPPVPPALGGTAGAIAPDRPARVASYTLRARLDAEKHEITGSGTLVLKNVADAPLFKLHFHLYLNAFKNERSVFLRSPFGEGRGGGRAQDWGYIDVKRLTARELDGKDLWPGRRQPIEGEPDGGLREPDDETGVWLPLPRAILPGETLTLDFDFVSKLPSIVLRTGYSGDFHLVAQWFPKLAHIDEHGDVTSFPFHPQAEFFANFGDYDVTLDVPSNMLVGATGERVESRTSGARRVDRYRATAVHDFAWTAWPEFRERNARSGDVAVRLLYPPGHEANATTTLETILHALPEASRRYGRYPYSTLTVVHPPQRAAEAGGMEYPTLITTGGPWYAGLLGDRALESVTIHELLHQWFYGLVATNEASTPFLDEGLTSYAEVQALDARYGNGSAFRGFDFELSAHAVARLLSAERAEDLPIRTAAGKFPGFRSLAALVYSRTATVLTTLERVYGEQKLARALGVYTARGRFRHPQQSDLLDACREELGAEAARALEQALNARGRVDFLVRDLENTRERSAGGVFEGDHGRETRPSELPAEPMYRGRAVVYRHGAVELPVEIELVGADGTRKRERWDRGGDAHVVEWRGRSPLAFVVVDPDQRVLLDDRLMNNAAAVAPQYPQRALERVSYLAALLFAGALP